MLLPEVTTYLGSLGIGLTGGTNLFYGPMKEEYPDAVVIVNEYGGTADEPNLGQINTDPTKNYGRGVRLEFPSVQFHARGVKNDYDGPRTQIEAVRTGVMKVLNQTLSGTLYLAIEPIQAPFHLRTDDNFREHFVFNARVTKEQS